MKVWKNIEGFEKYEVSNTGEVKGKRKMLNAKPDRYEDRYAYVTLFGDIKKKIVVHRLVAMAFIPNPLNLREVNHIDGDKFNNKVENLEWCTSSENKHHAIRLGLVRKCGNAGKFDEETLQAVRNMLNNGEKIKKVATHFNRSISCIKNIKLGRTWNR